MPDLDTIVTLDHPGFQVEKVDDQGVSVSKFDPDSEATRIDSERTWQVSFRAAENQEKPPATFRFAAAKVDGAELVYQRYVDADLAKVGPGDLARGEVRAAAVCVARLGRRRTCWRLRLSRSRSGSCAPGPRRVAVQRFQMPELVTPFSVLGLLREIQHKNGFSAPQSQELAGSIERIERHYFAQADGDAIDLRQVAETWIRRAS